MEIALLFIAGLIGGLAAGLLGIGGGIIYIIILPFAVENLSLEPSQLTAVVIANSILATFFAAIFSLIRHYKNGNIFIGTSVIVGLFGAVSSILLFNLIVKPGLYDFKSFNISISVLLIAMLVREFFSKRISVGENTVENKSKPLLASIGLFGGAVAALSGLGGGIIVVPLLMILAKIDVKKATSISMGFIAFSSLFLSLNNIILVDSQTQLILPNIIFPLIIGVVIGAPLGVNLAKRLTSKTLKLTFMSFVIIMLIYKLTQVFVA